MAPRKNYQPDQLEKAVEPLKNRKQLEKEERARQRIEKKKLKEQLTIEKKNKSKIKKTVQEDTTSEDSEVEIAYAESDTSNNLEDDEEQEPERAIITKDLDSIDSDLENLPIRKLVSSKAIKPNKSRFSMGSFVIIKYEGEYFLLGKIERLRKNNYEISTMTLTSGNSFKWPNPPDKIFYNLKEIIEVIKEPICLNKRGFYRISEMDKYLPNMYDF